VHSEIAGSCNSAPCNCQVFTCDHIRCGWKPREECQHPNKLHAGSLYDGPGGRKTWLYYTCPDCRKDWREEEEPPVTPEEEEQVPEDCETCKGMLAGWCRDCGRRVPDGSPGVPEGEDVCGYPNCTCSPESLCPGAAVPPPQPDRRPPYAVAYSVQGHLYEVALPGDATVQAVDGALVIQHAFGPVAGIVRVLPVLNPQKEGSDGS
jgi:hypothetical protein